ncbi:MAG: DUF4387 domain-containing protein [Sedimentisphaeraceae bacterium JB056]
MRLYDLADIIRSKNAGPFTLAIDLLFKDPDIFSKVVDSKVLSPELISKLYNVDSGKVLITPFETVRAIKVTLPRPSGVSAGAPGDTDVYGSSQHYPLADVKIFD